MYPQLRFAGGVLDHRAAGGEIAPQNRQGADLRLLRGEDHILPLESVVVQIADVPVEKVVRPQVLQVFSQGLAGAGHHAQIQMVPQEPLHHGDAAGEPEVLAEVFAAGIDTAQVGDHPVDLIEELRPEVDAQLSCNGGQVDHGVCGAADGRVYDNGVAEGGLRHDLTGCDALFHQVHHGAAGSAGAPQDVLLRGRGDGAAGQRQSQRFGHALHGGGGPHETARAHAGTACELVVADLPAADLVALHAQGDLSGLGGGDAVGAGAFAAAGDKNGGHVQPGGCLQVGGHGLVAGGAEDHAVPGIDGAVDLDEIAQRLPGGQDDVHPVVSLPAAVADVCGVEHGRMASPLINAQLCLIRQRLQVVASRMAVAPYVLHQDLRLGQISISSTKTQRSWIRRWTISIAA